MSRDIVIDNNRADAFDVLADKDILSKRLFKTKMCSSVTTKYKCPHGEKCRFAHSIDEIQLSTCLFGNQCKFWHNTTKTCPHLHPGETPDEFYVRTGLSKYKQVKKVETWAERIQKPQVPIPQNPTDEWTIMEIPRSMAPNLVKVAIDQGITRIKLIIVN